MTAYEFTKYNADFRNILKVRSYDINVVSEKININDPKHNYFRYTKEYKEASNIFIDLTMSCNKGEAIHWMEKWMIDALAYGVETKDLDWRSFFMAAYDIHASLLKH